MKMESSCASKSIGEVVEEIMRTHRSLSARPGIDELEAAKTLIRNVEKEDQSRLEAIARQNKSKQVTEEFFKVLQEMQGNLVLFHSKVQKREAMKLLDLENVHSLFDDLIQRTSKCLPSGSSLDSNHISNSLRDFSVSSLTNLASFSGNGLNSPVTTVTTTSSSSMYYEKDKVKASELFSKDDNYLKKQKSTFYTERLRPGDLSMPQILDSTLKVTVTSAQDGEKLSLIKLARLIEVSAKKGTQDLVHSNKLMDPIEWLPDSPLINRRIGLWLCQPQ